MANKAVVDKVEQSSTLYEEGRWAMNSGDYVAAVELFRKSADAFPHFKTLELLGECLLRLGRAPEAILPLGAAVGIGIVSKPFRSLFLLAKAMNAEGHRKQALRHLDFAIEMKPDYKSAHELREEILSHQSSSES